MLRWMLIDTFIVDYILITSHDVRSHSSSVSSVHPSNGISCSKTSFLPKSPVNSLLWNSNAGVTHSYEIQQEEPIYKRAENDR